MATAPKTTTQPSQTLEPLYSIPFITAYTPKPRLQVKFNPANSRTKQSHKDECDINKIMSRYQRTGVLDFVQKHQPQYADVSGLDYQTAMETVAASRSMFMDLPSSIRSRFENDPAKFMDFVHDPANKVEMAEMGLLTPQATMEALNPTAPLDPGAETPPAPDTGAS